MGETVEFQANYEVEEGCRKCKPEKRTQELMKLLFESLSAERGRQVKQIQVLSNCSGPLRRDKLKKPLCQMALDATFRNDGGAVVSRASFRPGTEDAPPKLEISEYTP